MVSFSQLDWLSRNGEICRIVSEMSARAANVSIFREIAMYIYVAIADDGNTLTCHSWKFRGY